MLVGFSGFVIGSPTLEPVKFELNPPFTSLLLLVIVVAPALVLGP